MPEEQKECSAGMREASCDSEEISNNMGLPIAGIDNKATHEELIQCHHEIKGSMHEKTEVFPTCYTDQGELIWWRGLILCQNLDKRISANPSVQVNHNTVQTNGCLVTLQFNTMPNPQVRQDIAGMLLTAFEKRRSIQE